MMGTRENSVRIILTLIIGCQIHDTQAGITSSSSLEQGLTRNILEPFLHNLAESGEDILFLDNFKRNMNESITQAANERISWWNSLNTAIDEFVREYESQHPSRKIKRVDRQLKITDSAKAYHDFSTRAFQLDFYLRENGGQNDLQSSVLVVIPELGMLYKQVAPLKVYDKEKYMYETVLPSMYQGWAHEKLSPNFYASTESGMLIIENFHDGSYKTQNSLLDSAEKCELVFKALAQFHALSISHLDDVVYSTLKTLTPVQPLVEYTLLIANLIETVENVMAQVDKSLPSNMLEKLVTLTDEDLKIMSRDYYTENANGFNVLLHGSPDRRNVFFHLDSPQTTDAVACKFTNFQSSRRGSPVLDLMTYLLSSVEFEVYEKKGDALFDSYLRELNKNLANLDDEPRYDMTMLRADLRRYRSVFVFVLMYVIPLRWSAEMPLNMNDLTEVHSDTLQSDKFITFCTKWLNVFLT